jgi:hypothetical protein
MIIDTLVLRDVKVAYASTLLKANFTLPSIEMHNIGKDKGGATSGEVAMQLTQTLTSSIA